MGGTSFLAVNEGQLDSYSGGKEGRPTASYWPTESRGENT